MSFATLLRGLRDADVKYIVVGGLAASAHGSRRITDDLDICYDATAGNLERLSALLSKWNAYPRGIETGLPFFMDARQFRTTPIMTLTTDQGFIDVAAMVVPTVPSHRWRRRQIWKLLRQGRARGERQPAEGRNQLL